MTTPFTYRGLTKQERNEAGHAAQEEFFEAAKKPEGAPGGIEHKFDRGAAISGNWCIQSDVVDGDCKFLIVSCPGTLCLIERVEILREYLKEYPPTEPFSGDFKRFESGKFTQISTSDEANVTNYLIPIREFVRWKSKNLF